MAVGSPPPSDDGAGQVRPQISTVRFSAGAGTTNGPTTSVRTAVCSIGDLARLLAVRTPHKRHRYVCPGLMPTEAPAGASTNRSKALGRDAEFVGMDFDGCSVRALARALADLRRQGLAYVASTTYSHATKAEPWHARVRLLLFPSSAIPDAASYDAQWAHWASWAEAMGLGNLDPAPRHIASVFYVGRATSPRDWTRVHHGHGFDLVEVPPPVERLTITTTSTRPELPGTRRARAKAYLEVVPATASEPDLYRLICRVIDLCPDEGDVIDLVLAWADRVGPTHSTGVPFTADEIRSKVQGAYRYRGSQPGSEPERELTFRDEDSAENWTVPLPVDGPDIASILAGGDDEDAANDGPEDDGAPLPVIVLTPDEPAILQRALEALATLPEVYLRGRELVEVVGTEARPVKAARLSILLSSCARWARAEKDRLVECHPPKWLVDGILASPLDGSMRSLDLITSEPVLMRGGLVSTPGYQDGVLHVGDGLDVVVPDAPTQEDARAAAEKLLDVVHDFPFASPASRSAWVAALLTVVGRAAIDGPTPMFPASANVRGSGKGLLVDALSIIATGRPPARQSYVSAEAEQDKRITAALRTAPRALLLDEVTTKFGGGPLNNLATAWPLYEGRELGQSRMLALPATAVVACTGNNIAYRGDMIRRVVPILLESIEERPEDRGGFRHPRLLDHVRRHRGALLGGALTMLRSAVQIPAAQRPNLRPFGSYEAWGDLIRVACVHAGLADPVDAREAIKDEDDDVQVAGELHDLIVQHHGTEGVSAAQLEALANLNDDVMTILRRHCRGGYVDAKKIGYVLRPHRNRVIAGRKLVGERDRRKTMRWRVVMADGSAIPTPFDLSNNVLSLSTRQPDPDAILATLMED